jgi:hypothetical protein
MPRTDVLGEILACAAHELRPIVEKTQVAPELVSLGEMEGRILQALWRIGAFALGLLCGLGSGRRKKYVAGHTSVGQGRHRLPFKGTPKKTLLTIFGRIAFRRAYYHSSVPKDSRWPRDEQLGLTPGQIWSPGLSERADYLATVTGSYQEGAKTLTKMFGVEVHYKQIQRDCLQVGAEAADRQQEEARAALQVKQEQPPPGTKGPECILLSVDGVVVQDHDSASGLEIKIGRVDRACLQMPAPTAGTKAKTNPAPEATERSAQLAELKDSREKREYRAATGLVKEALAKVAPDRHKRSVYRPSNPTSSYVATAEKGTEAIGGLLWAAAVAAGVQTAALVLFLADGAHWCWNLCKTNFPGAIQILDVFHLAKHLFEAGGVMWGEKSGSSRDWALQALVAILEGRLDEVLRELEGLTFTEARKREARRELLVYLGNNRERMDYPKYIAAGYPISSAMIEGACGHVIGRRMKGSGRRWDEAGADAMARLRALHCSGRWDAFFADHHRRIRDSLAA